MSYLDPDLQRAQTAATAAQHAAMRPHDAPRGFIQIVWAELVRRNHAVADAGLDAQILAANEAFAVMTAIGQLDRQHYLALGAVERRAQSGRGGHFPEEAEAIAAAVASHPVLAKFQAECDLAAQKKGAEAEVTRQLHEAERERAAPGVLLAVLHSRGVTLELSRDGKHITTLPRFHALMQQDEIEMIRKRSADFLVLLKAEAAAAAPVVII